MSERLKTFAEGDLDSEFPEYDAKDEVAEMIEMAREMADNLNVIISDSGRLLNEMADGNFAIATDHEERYTGKFNDLLIGIRNMNRKINDSLHQVEETAEQVSMGSGNMAEAHSLWQKVLRNRPGQSKSFRQPLLISLPT